MRSRLLRTATAALSGLALVLAPLAATPGLGVTLSRAEYEACQARDEKGFRTAVEAISLKALEQGLAGVDYRASVQEGWQRLGIDGIIDQRVDAAINEVRDETSWGQLMQSLAYQEKAKELATTVADRVYRSDAMKAAIESLAVGVGKEVGKAIEQGTMDAAEPAAECMRAFLGPRFGSTVAKAVAQDAGEQFRIDPAKASADVSRGSILLQGGEGIAGAVILLVRRQLSNMASRIGSRIVGVVMGRIVSLVAGGVGVVLLAKDLWELRNGVLPIISEEMKSKETKRRVQDELTAMVGEQLTEQTKDIAARAADRVTEIWLEFRRAHAKVLDIAEQNAEFRTFLDRTRAEQLPRLDEVVALVVAGEGDAGVSKRLSDGTLSAAVNTLDQHGMDIARDTRSIDAALAWHALAGDRLALVVDNGIHKRVSPADLSKSSLNRLLNLNDRLASVRLAGIKRDARDVLFELTDTELRTLARGLGESELETLARYLTGLQKSASERVLRAVAQSPGRMQVLAEPRVRDGLLASRDQDAAVGMMLRTGWTLDPFALRDDTALALDGRVSPILLWEKHTIAVTMVGLLGAAFLLALLRLVFGRRRRVYG